jgi:hypothetical protein
MSLLRQDRGVEVDVTDCRRAILAPDDVVVDRRDIEGCIERLQRADDDARRQGKVGYAESAVEGVLDWLKAMRDRARTGRLER